MLLWVDEANFDKHLKSLIGQLSNEQILSNELNVRLLMLSDWKDLQYKILLRCINKHWTKDELVADKEFFLIKYVESSDNTVHLDNYLLVKGWIKKRKLSQRKEYGTIDQKMKIMDYESKQRNAMKFFKKLLADTQSFRSTPDFL